VRAREVFLSAPGQVSPTGTGVPSLVTALGERDWRPELGLELPDAPPLPVAACRTFTTQGHLPPMVARRLDRPARLLAVAARESLAALGPELPWPGSRTGVSAATGNAGTEALFQVLRAVFLASPDEAPPMQFPSTVANAPASQLAILEKLSGPNVTFAEKQVGGLRALIEAGRMIGHGRADAVLAAAVDEAQWLNAECYRRLRATATTAASGLTVGEGAAVLVAEEGRRDGAVRLAGWGAASTPTTTYLFPSEPAALASAMRDALARAGRDATDIDLVVSMADGSPALARLESAALAAVLGAHRPAAFAMADRTGEGSFAGLLRVVAALLALGSRVIPAWDPPNHLSETGFRRLERPPRAALVAGVAGGGSALAVVLD